MKKSFCFLTLILVVSILISACNAPENNFGNSTVDNTEIPDSSADMPLDKFSSIRNSGEEWLLYGLQAHENGKKAPNLKDFFSDKSNMLYLTLYDYMFQYDANNSIPVAEALFEFIYTEYGIDALMNTEKRIEYKSAYLKSLGLDMEYPQTSEVEQFFISMEFSSTDEYKYEMTFDNTTYRFKDFNAGSPSEYHGFLYYNTTGLWELIKYLNDYHISEGFDTDRQFNYYLTFNGSNYSVTKYETGNMYINDSYSALHEAVHAMGIMRDDNIWLSEGLCNYFGKMLGFNDQIAAAYIQLLSMAEKGYFDEKADAEDATAITHKEVYERFNRAGGKLGLVSEFDFRLYHSILSKYELELGVYDTLGDTYKAINGKECQSIGGELSYNQATSLVTYLVDTYGIDKVLDAYKTQNIINTFGKNYEQLKTEWIATLA